VTNKVSLATSDLSHVPKAFHLPKDKDKFLAYANAHPEKLWVKKSNDHRGIRVEQADKMNLETEGTFVQEFIHNPLLIDGKYDIIHASPCMIDQ
jgi:tubulin monoglycylase TTLL15